MLRELVKHFGDAHPRCPMDSQSADGKKAPDEAPSGLDKGGQKTFTRLENGSHRDWRPRLYW